MIEEGVVRRRDLPHIDVEGKPYFVTACLAGSLAAAGLKRIRSYRNQLEERKKPEALSQREWDTKKHKLVFKLVESLLDSTTAVEHLSNPRLAEVVKASLLYFAGERYDLFAFSVMPSHLHWVFLPDYEWSQQFADNKKRTPRESISHSIQSYTANRCNRLLCRKGKFWQGETYDHYARDDSELARIIHYVEHNPVAAGLADEASEFQWSSACIRKELGLGPVDAIPKAA